MRNKLVVKEDPRNSSSCLVLLHSLNTSFPEQFVRPDVIGPFRKLENVVRKFLPLFKESTTRNVI